MKINISGCLLVLIILYAVSKVTTGYQEGGTLKQVDIHNKYQEPSFNQQYKELDDVDNVLNRPINQEKTLIDDLQASNAYKSYIAATTMDEITPELVSGDVHALIENKQPYFLDESLVIDKYGKKFYHDSRYPKQPISIDFIKNPAEYTKNRPNEYPSYVIASRNYDNLKPNSYNNGKNDPL